MSDKIKQFTYGVGINDSKNVKYKKSYKVWRCMIQRCYDIKYFTKYPTYAGCEVCNDWKIFSNFEKWFEENYRYDLIDMGISLELDKDLIIDGNKTYSPDTCIFIPKRANGFLTNVQQNNTSGYIGVCYHKNSGRWVAQIKEFKESSSNRSVYLGIYPTPEEAHEAYVAARKIEAEKCKSYMLSLGYSKLIVDKIK